MEYKFINKNKIIIGMVHLLPLPGAPLHDFNGGMSKIIERAFEDVKMLIAGGIDGIQIENQWDRPFEKGQEIGKETISSIAAIAGMLKREFNIPMGVNIHLNGALEAMAIASATGCEWIRVFELCNAYISNSGYIEAAGPELLRYRMKLRMEDKVKILGDFHVKYGSHQIVGDRNIIDLAKDVQTALADGLIITGLETGQAPNIVDINKIKKSVNIPVLIGSGLSIENIKQLLPGVDGAIVGSGFKQDGNLMNPIDKKRVQNFMNIVNEIRG
ncbi:MAG TPA: BtpA family membrane complex biogenesis protein [Spirochaeta sp.]|nr:BtpA family membrane complex biogenesis protein [Spirochaeta sp.]